MSEQDLLSATDVAALEETGAAMVEALLAMAFPVVPVVVRQSGEDPREAKRGKDFWSALGKKISNGSRIPDGYDRHRP